MVDIYGALTHHTFAPCLLGERLTDSEWDAINQRAQQILARADQAAAEQAAKAKIADEARTRDRSSIQRIAVHFYRWATNNKIEPRSFLCGRWWNKCRLDGWVIADRTCETGYTPMIYGGGGDEYALVAGYLVVTTSGDLVEVQTSSKKSESVRIDNVDLDAYSLENVEATISSIIVSLGLSRRKRDSQISNLITQAHRASRRPH